MTPVPCVAPRGEVGDCYRACLASVLNLSPHDVPHFAANGADWTTMFEHAREWLRPLGLGIYRTYCSAPWALEDVLRWFSAKNPGVPVIVMGKSQRDPEENHAVVAMDGAIVHDPSGSGLSGPCLGDEWWWLDIVAFTDFSKVAA